MRTRRPSSLMKILDVPPCLAYVCIAFFKLSILGALYIPKRAMLSVYRLRVSYGMTKNARTYRTVSKLSL